MPPFLYLQVLIFRLKLKIFLSDGNWMSKCPKVGSFMLLPEQWWNLWILLRGSFGRVWSILFWRSWVRLLIKSIERLFSAKETGFLQRSCNYTPNVPCTKACLAFTSRLQVKPSRSSHKQFQNYPSFSATLWSAANTMEWAREDFPLPIWTKKVLAAFQTENSRCSHV